MILGIFPALSLNVAAYQQNTELLSNPGFESSDLSMWTLAGCALTRDSSTFNSGSYSAKVTNRAFQSASPQQDITQQLMACGQGLYTYSANIKLLAGQAACTMYVVISIESTQGTKKWYTPALKTITSDAFTQSIDSNRSITWQGTLTRALIYVQNGSTYTTDYPGIYLDDYSLVKNSAIVPEPTAVPYIPTTQTTDQRGTGAPSVGVIRWDAWLPSTQGTFGTNDVSTNMGAQAARTLGPNKYHYRLPYFALSNGDNSVDFPAYTQAQMDSEIRYAAYAGIDYWAYGWYPIGSGMDTARNLHVSSALRDKVKMSAILGVSTFGEAEQEQLIGYFKESFYIKVQDGRPLLFFYTNTNALATIISIQQDCLAAGIPLPYCVSMEGAATGMDAVSAYSATGTNGASFSSLAQSAEAKWDTQKNAGSKVVPLVSTGWDARPIYDNPVTWTTATANSWVQTPTTNEISAHLQDSINWTKNNTSTTMANTVLMYAWNEHDEGGWLCPTAKVDASGNVLTSSGQNLVNTDRIDALHNLLRPVSIPTINPWGTAEPTPLPVPTTSAINFTIADVNGNCGQKIDVKVDISENSNISAGTLVLNFDNTKLEYIVATAGSSMGGLSDINTTDSKITMAYINMDGLKNGGTILDAQFKIKSNIPDATIPISFEVPELIDSQAISLPFNITAGNINIKNFMLGDLNNNFVITSSDALMALQLASGHLSPTDYTSVSADVNKDGNTTALDALQILQFASGKINSFDTNPQPIGIPAVKWTVTELAFNSSYSDNTSIITGTQSDFESTSIPTGWSAFGDGSLSVSSTVAHSGTKSFCLASRTQAWSSPTFNIYSTLKNAGVGSYNISFWIYADAMATNPQSGRMIVRGGSSADANSFIVNNGGAYYGSLSAGNSTALNTWTKYSATLNVTQTDIARASGTFNLMIDSFPAAANQKIYLDDFAISKIHYTSPFNDVQMDATFTSPDGSTLVMPAFWDGGTTWKVRFAPTVTGNWTYNTTCSDTTNTGLNNQSGLITCYSYAGSLDIFKHGFIKASQDNRYFTYADGTPFFYLGDTHWSLPMEPIDSSVVSGIPSQFKYIIDKRVDQGFTVIQSEPIGTMYNLGDGFTQADIAGFQDLDRRFQYIASKGLVHANAELFFASELGANGYKYSDAYLEKLCRYWAARYSAYPVMWTTAQEVDNDFYHGRLDENGNDMNPYYDATTNPWKKVAAWVHQYDPYSQPLSAHQEYASMDPNSGANATKSSFKNVPGDNWYAVQWSPAKNSQLDFSIPEDFWNSEVRKPTVNYEGSYDHLWTLEFGARQQGWTAYLNGMYGQGYGAEDIWLYNSTYNTDVPTTNNGVTVTVEDKAVKWYDSINFPAAYELGYMHNFFNAIEWWNLTPRFDDSAWFNNNGSFYSIASKNNSLYVAYFYNATQNTGTIKGLANVAYTTQWYNPITGVYSAAATIKISNGRYFIGNKPDNNDWVLIMKKCG